MSTTTKRLGTKQDFEDLRTLARLITDACEDFYSLALSVGEIGSANTAEDTRRSFTEIAARLNVRVDESRLNGELRVAKIDHSTAHRDAAVRAGTWAKLDADGNLTPGILADLEAGR